MAVSNTRFACTTRSHQFLINTFEVCDVCFVLYTKIFSSNKNFLANRYVFCSGAILILRARSGHVPTILTLAVEVQLIGKTLVSAVYVLYSIIRCLKNILDLIRLWIDV